MASSINGATINVSGSPDIKYYITYTTSRSSNSSVTYNFTIKTYLVGSDNSWLGDGYKLTAYFTVNGVQKSVVLKGNSEIWSGGTSDGTLKSTKSVSVTCVSTTGKTNQTVTFQVVNEGTLDGKAGEIQTTNYYVTSPAICTAPTTFTINTSSPFEDKVKLSWSGATAGSNNNIDAYLIRYNVSSNNSTWDGWKDLTTEKETSTSCEESMASKVSRGYYVKFAIRVNGSTYNSDWKYSSTIRRASYTKCSAPTSISFTNGVSNNTFEDSITFSWNGASGGTSNSIVGYDIRCAVYNSAGTSIEKYCSLSGTQNSLTSISSTSNKGSKTATLSWVTRGRKIVIQIRTKGSAGSSYYSDWKNSTAITRNLYSDCVAPTTVTLTSEKDLNGNTHSDIFESQVTIKWSGAIAGANNSITGYYIQVRLKDDETGEWEKVYYDLNGETDSTTDKATQINTTSSGGSITAILDWIPRGKTATIIMATLGSAGLSYRSAYKSYDVAIKRNSIPNAVSTISVSNLPSLEFSNGNDIVLNWEKPNDIDDNIHHYRIQVSIGSKNDVIDYYGTTMLSNSAKVVWTDLIGSLSENSNAMTFEDPLTSNSYIVLNSSTISHTLNSSNAYYGQVDNSNSADSNSVIQFRIRTVDIFGTYSDNDYVYSPIITRYDMTGIAIGINGKWVNCQLFVGKNGFWVEQTVSAGINGSWVDVDNGM